MSNTAISSARIVSPPSRSGAPSHCRRGGGPGSLLQNTFLVSVDNPFLVSAVLADTIYTIRKMNDFWYRLFRTNINNINRANTQFSIGPSVVIVAERPCC
jgi:hypothetical protein